MSAETNLIWQAFDRPCDGRAHLYCWEQGRYLPITWSEWRRGAERSAAGLRSLGVRPGSRVAAVLTNGASVCNAILGAWLAGATLISLPTLRRGMSPGEYVAQLEALCAAADVELMLLEEQFLAMLDRESFGTPVASFDSAVSDVAVDFEPLPDDAPAFVQYSSGSTSEPKGIVLSMGAIGRQEGMLAERMCMDADCLGVVWLPLSHDMGLFGALLLSWASAARLALGTPERFLRQPHTWFDDCAEFGATITVAPNFGLALATRKARTRPPKGSCPLRTLVLGGERIELETLVGAQEVLGPYGVTSETLTPAYGLAEGTLSVTMKPHLESPRSVWIDREAAYNGELSLRDAHADGSTAIVSCGPPMPGVEVGIEGGAMGRIRLRSASLADGYVNDPQVTAERFAAGAFQTEDLGFIHDGELCVLGRTDDVIVFAGRNVYARDIEREIEEHDGVRTGCSAIVDGRTDGQPHMVLVAEPSHPAPDLQKIAADATAIAFRAGGLHLSECVFVRPGQLPKTPSGKVQRFRCRALLADNSGAVLDRVAT